MKCKKCGQIVSEKDNFCNRCGTKVKTATKPKKITNSKKKMEPANKYLILILISAILYGLLFTAAAFASVFMPILLIPIVAVGSGYAAILWRIFKKALTTVSEESVKDFDLLYIIIKEVDLYEERLEPAWEYPNRNDQWLFAEKVKEHVGTEYDILYVYADNTYREAQGMKTIPESVWEYSRNDLDYDDTKSRLRTC